MPHLRLKLNAAAVEDWLADLSTKLPDTTFNVSATIPTDEGLLGIIEVRNPDRESLVHYFDDASQVNSYEVIHDDDQIVLLQFMSRMTESYNVLLASGTVPQYPLSFRTDGIRPN